ncbi:hypothetical protein E2C01_060494 [Portunus trituberculatus]|uniref:Uncharacterized protein n=1 Tax=Portunus trituberculatus TaxID=210409 RepID=A0A5B7H8V6_PORTR|nr:hypothetical protein [Portunus trituberculatus]
MCEIPGPPSVASRRLNPTPARVSTAPLPPSPSSPPITSPHYQISSSLLPLPLLLPSRGCAVVGCRAVGGVAGG